MQQVPRALRGFTLIELSIVLVIIGFIVGGVLVGQDLIRAAKVRATISQIEKFNTATNTFYGKFGYLPGDVPAAPAAQFGFAVRGSLAGQGDGNGVLEGNFNNAPGGNTGNQVAIGEEGLFWVDLSQAGLIDGAFNTATATSIQFSTPNVGLYLPPAKVGGGNYFYVYSGGLGVATNSDNQNYLGLSIVNSIYTGTPDGPTGLTVQEAYNIDKKIDDGLPQSGRATATYLNRYSGTTDSSTWAGTTGMYGAPYTTATVGSATTCFDNSATSNGTPGVGGASQHYSLEMNSGGSLNCALSFRFQ